VKGGSCVCDHVDIGIGLMKVNDDPSCPACHPLGCNCGCQPVDLPEPNGCAECGIGRRQHFQRWRMGVGRHGWTEPTDAQRLARMLARRNARRAT
jgi:hypothetical protein